MARALAAVLAPEQLTVIVNVGDDDAIYGLAVSPDLDTVVYTLAGVEGPQGWGRRDDTFRVMAGLGEQGVDTWFRLGDRDLAMCLRRTEHLAAGGTLSRFTAGAASALGVPVAVLPATDDRLRTQIRTADGVWRDFQDYFVRRRHRDRVLEVRYDGADDASPAPGVLDAIDRADVVVIAPSNPVLSVQPILAVGGVRAALSAKPAVVAVSPLFGGRALKGPAATIMADLGMAAGTAGLLASYEGLLSHLVVDAGDAGDVAALAGAGVSLHAADTRIGTPGEGARFAAELMDILGTRRNPVSSSLRRGPES